MSDQQPIRDDLQASARLCLMGHTAPLRFAPPWSFVPVGEHIRGPIRGRTRMLAALREQFDDATLLQVGVLEQHPSRGLRVAPALTRRGGRVMAIQSSAQAPPSDLLVASGLLSGVAHPVLAAQQDYRVNQLARALGVVMAAGDITAVALLSALGLPATLGAGLHRLSLDEIRRLNDASGEGLPQFEFEPETGPDAISAEGTALPPEPAVAELSAGNDRDQDGTGDSDIEFPPSPPALLLVDWDPIGLSAARQPWIEHTAVRLAEVRRSAGLPLGGVFVWRPHPAMLDRLRFAANSQNFELAQAALVDSLDAVEDFETILADRQLESRPAHNERRSAAARLRVQAAVDPLGGDTTDRESANQERAAAIEQELLAPLREYALTRPNPVVRNTVVLLADVAQLLYLLGPQVQDALGRSLTSAAPSDTTHGTLNQYLSLIDRYGRLCGALRSWSR